MTLTVLLAAGLGGGLGAGLRVGVLGAAARTALAPDRALALLNAAGCLIAGMIVAAAPAPAVEAFAVSGVLGGFTTLSSWVAALDGAGRRRRSAAAWAVADLVVGLAAALAGHAIVA